MYKNKNSFRVNNILHPILIKNSTFAQNYSIMKQDFFNYQAQTSHFASGFEVERAEGNYIYGKDGRAYLDFVSGISANGTGTLPP